MSVKYCKMMQETVAIASHGGEYEIRFSQLEYLRLHDFPCLTSFSLGSFDFHFPALEEVVITGCPNMNVFAEQVSTAPKLRKVKTEHNWEWESSLKNTVQALFMGKSAQVSSSLQIS